MATSVSSMVDAQTAHDECVWHQYNINSHVTAIIPEQLRDRELPLVFSTRRLPLLIDGSYASYSATTTAGRSSTSAHYGIPSRLTATTYFSLHQRQIEAEQAPSISRRLSSVRKDVNSDRAGPGRRLWVSTTLRMDGGT